jgi:hypothetical protein
VPVTVTESTSTFDSRDGTYTLRCHDVRRDGAMLGSAWCPEQVWRDAPSGGQVLVDGDWRYYLHEDVDAPLTTGIAPSLEAAVAAIIRLADEAVAAWPA